MNPTRTAGDKLITYNFQGGQVDSIEVREWSGIAWGDPVEVMLSGSARGVDRRRYEVR